MPRRLTLSQAALAVVRRLRENGHEALWAGGCVRDMLLRRQPADIDVATDAPPDRVVALFRRTRKVGVKFGVVMIRQGRYWIETATFRTDSDYTDGRHPDRVEFTTAEHDAQRRDFTINGLFYDPTDEQVIDYVNGRADLEARIIRAIGDPARRFAEDHLRMLRAVRFATRFGFAIEPSTADAIREHAAKIRRISPERIREELAKMLSAPARAEAMKLIADLGLLGHLWNDASWPRERVRQVSDALAALPEEADFTLALAAVLHDHDSEHIRRIGQTLRCSNQQIHESGWLVGHVDAIRRADGLALSTLKKLIAHPRFEDLLALHEAVCQARGLPTEGSEIARRRHAAIPPDQIAPPPFVTGDDLIDRGLEPGPRYKHILDTLYDEQLDNRLASRDEALQRLRTILTDT